MRALIGVEYFRLAVSAQRLVERRDAKARVHRVRQPPRQDRAAGPIDDRHQIEKAARHRDVGDVGRPHVVWLSNRQAAQKIGIYPVSRRGLARSWAWNQRLDAHHPHQPLHALAVEPAAFLVEFEQHPPRAVERQFEMQFIDAAHQDQIVPARLGFRPVNSGARQVQQRALPTHGQILGWMIDHRSAIGRAHRPGLLAKKSRSTVSWPILA